MPILEENFERVNPDWIADYDMTEIQEDSDIDAIQKVIDDANKVKLEDEDAIKEMFDKEDLLEQKALIEKYAKPTDKGEKTDGTEKALEAIEIQLALLDVRAATTPNRLKTAFTALDELVAKDDKFMAEEDKDDEDYKGYVDANAKLYFELDKDNNDVADFKEVINAGNVKTIIKKVNDEVDEEQGNINDKISIGDSEAETRVTELANRVAGKDYLLGYSFWLELDQKETYEDVREIEVDLLDGDKFLGKTEFKDYNDLNELVIDKSKTNITGTIDVFGAYEDDYWTQDWDAGLTDIPTKAVFKVTFANGDVAEQTLALDLTREGLSDLTPVFVEALNRTTTAEEMSAALVNLEAHTDDNSVFTNLPSSDKLIVAERVLEQRNKEEGIDGVANTAGKFFNDDKELDASYVLGEEVLKKYTGARTTLLGELNSDSGLTDITDVKTILANAKVVLPEYDELSAVKKTNAAEAVLNTLNAEDFAGFKTIAAIKTAAGL